MAESELPFPNNARADNSSLFGGARLGRRKKTIFLLLVVAVFFVLWFNTDIERLNTSNNAISDSNRDTAGPGTIKKPPVVQDDVEDEDEIETEEEETKVVPPPQKEQTKPPQEETNKPSAVYKPPTTIYKSTPQHFRYFIVIASRTGNLSRRQLIRKTYFGLDNNVEPCMKRDKGIDYLFWLYGDEPAANTPERRLYETEKIEWNDLEKVNKKAYDQDEVLKWAETTLKDRGVTYDYLIVQDGYSLIQLNYMQQTIQAEVGQFPEGQSAFDLAWVSPENSNALVAGSIAVKKLLEPTSDLEGIVNTKGDNTLMANFYEFYRSINVQLNFVTSKKEVDRLQKFKAGLPYFINDKGRFTAWSNNVEAIPDLSISVANIYQDNDFTSVAKRLSLGAAGICKPLEKASIAVVTSSYIYDRCMEPSAALAADNKRQYALAHNYAFVARSSEFAQQDLRAEKRRTVWGKIDAVQKVLPKYDWIFWMDMDAVILNPDHTVQGILDTLRKDYPEGPRAFEKNIDLVIAKPTKDKMINAGVFFMRNTEWAQKFLNAVQESKNWYNKGPSYEQGAMWDLIQEPGYKEHVLLLENDDHTFNTLPKRYVPGDFIVHFAPDKCPNDAVLSGLRAADQIQRGQTVTSFEE